MILDDFQAAYGRLLMGRGTPYSLDWSSTGLLDVPSLRTSDTDRARGDGAWVGEDFADAQTIGLSLKLMGQAGVDLSHAVRVMEDATTPRTPRDLWYKLPHFETARCLRDVRVRRRAIPVQPHFREVVEAEFELYAPDPTRYGVTERRTFEAQAHEQFLADIVVGGNQPTWPTITVHGYMHPETPLVLTEYTTGSVIRVQTHLQEGEKLVIDQRTGTALINGRYPRPEALLERGWWAVQPGQSFRLGARCHTWVTVDVEWSPAWW